MPLNIPFNRAPEATLNCPSVGMSVSSGQTAGGGSFCDAAQDALVSELGCKEAIMVTSCSHALELCARLLQLKPGDEVIVPSFTFVTTASSFATLGARPVFADICPQTFNIDPVSVERLIGPTTRAIVVVHYAGIAADLDALTDLANRHDLVLIEDNAHGLFGRLQGRPLGSWGSLATQSFHNTKNFSCGEGGALIINDERFVERANVIADKGTNRVEFQQGKVDKYEWVDLGSSYRLAEPLAAMLVDQFERRDLIQEQRKQCWLRYQHELEDWSAGFGVRQPVIPADCVPAWHIYALLMPDGHTRERFIQYMGEGGVHCVFHYQPLHTSPYAQAMGLRADDCSVSTRVSRRLVRLPLWFGMTSGIQDRVIERILSFRP